MLQVSVQSLSFSVNPFATIEKHTLFTGVSPNIFMCYALLSWFVKMCL